MHPLSVGEQPRGRRCVAVAVEAPCRNHPPYLCSCTAKAPPLVARGWGQGRATTKNLVGYGSPRGACWIPVRRPMRREAAQWVLCNWWLLHAGRGARGLGKSVACLRQSARVPGDLASPVRPRVGQGGACAWGSVLLTAFDVARRVEGRHLGDGWLRPLAQSEVNSGLR